MLSFACRAFLEQLPDTCGWVGCLLTVSFWTVLLRCKDKRRWMKKMKKEKSWKGHHYLHHHLHLKYLKICLQLNKSSPSIKMHQDCIPSCFAVWQRLFLYHIVFFVLAILTLFYCFKTCFKLFHTWNSTYIVTDSIFSSFLLLDQQCHVYCFDEKKRGVECCVNILKKSMGSRTERVSSGSCSVYTFKLVLETTTSQSSCTALTDFNI